MIHTKRSSFAVFGLLITALLGACGDDDTTVCTPGTTMACLGTARCEGVQICEADGRSFGACMCDGVDGGVDGSVTDGGSPSDGSAMDAPDGSTEIDAASPPGPPRAFFSAVGAGSLVTGGRGGTVVPVTRLDDARNDDDSPVEGTLRYALTRRFPRIVVFRVSGTIVIGDSDGDGVRDVEGRFPGILALESEDFSNLTVAGQTAPEGGITIRGHIYMSGVSNQIWRYVRVRKNPIFNDFDAITIGNTHDIVLDHLSLSYGTDEGVSLSSGTGSDSPQHNVTLQNNLIAESKTGSIIGTVTTRDHGGECTLYNNFYTQVSHRFPNLAADGQYEVINNLAYNWRNRLVNVHNAPTVNHIANAYVAGPWTPSSDLLRVANKVHTGTEGILDARIYTAGNFITDVLTDPSADNWPSWRIFVTAGGFTQNDPAPAALQADSMFPLLGVPVTIRTAEDVRMHLPDEVGAFRTLDENGRVVTFRDSLDTGYIDDYRNGTGATSAIDPDTFVYPDLPANAPYADGDGDGMPDAWEMANGFDPETDDSAGDADDDGYTNLEEFLNLVDID